MIGRRLWPKKGTWWDPEDGGPWTSITFWRGWTSWLIGVDVDRHPSEWTVKVQVGPLAVSLFHAKDPRSVRQQIRDFVSIPIDWTGFGRTRGGFSDGTYLSFPTAPRYYQPEEMFVSSGEPPTILEQVQRWRAAWRPWMKWYPPISTRLLFPTVTAPRGGISFLPPPVGPYTP